METNLSVNVSPHIFSKRTTRNVMLDVIIALVPTVIAATIIFGIRSLYVVCASIAASVIFEALFNIITKRKQTIGDLSAVITGLLLALNLASTVPLWQIIVGDFIAIIVAKNLFGGLGANFANPAITGRVFMLIVFTEAMTAVSNPVIIDEVASATPLSQLSQGVHISASLTDMFLGLRAGAIGETCILALLIGFVYLLVRKVITWHTPVMFILTVFLFALIYSGSFENALYYTLSGGVFLGAIFMATDYVTTPTTPWGRIIFGIGCGLLTSIIRFYGSYPEGASFSILLMNLVSPFIEKHTMRKPFGGVTK